MALDYNEVFEFMKEFEIDLLNRFDEFIIDEPTNTYVSIKECKNMSDVKTYVVFALCRPISKGLDAQSSSRLLKRLNKYFNVNLTKKDCLVMYQKLCYLSKIEQFKDFIQRGFPMSELKTHYYEIVFYGEGHPNDWSYYIKADTLLSNKDVANKLRLEFIGIDGLEQHHIDNINSINTLTAQEFTAYSGIETLI